MLVSIDPGLDTGWAMWESYGLFSCGLSDPPRAGVTEVWIESQVIYPRSRARPADILKLAQDAGRWAGIYAAQGIEAHFVEPARWKGQVPKSVHHPRIWAALDARAQSIVDAACRGMAPSKRHNVIDAVGIGLWVRRHA